MKFIKNTLLIAVILFSIGSLPGVALADINRGGESFCKEIADIGITGGPRFSGNPNLQYNSSSEEDITVLGLAANTGDNEEDVRITITPQTPNTFSKTQRFIVTVGGVSKTVTANSDVPIKVSLVDSYEIDRINLSIDGFTRTPTTARDYSIIPLPAAGSQFKYTCTRSVYGQANTLGTTPKTTYFEGGYLNVYRVEKQSAVTTYPPTICSQTNGSSCTGTTTIQRGDSATLKWNTGGPALNCSISPTIGSVNAARAEYSQEVYPTQSTTYTLSCDYPSAFPDLDRRSVSTRVIVNEGSTTQPILSGPSQIILGETIPYTTSSTGMSSCKLLIVGPNGFDDDVSVSPNGSYSSYRPASVGTVATQIQCLNASGTRITGNTVNTRVVANNQCGHNEEWNSRTQKCERIIGSCELPRRFDSAGRCVLPNTNTTGFKPYITVNGNDLWESKSGERVNLEWRIPQNNPDLEYCSINPNTNGRRTSNGNQYVTPTVSTTYYIRCYDHNGEAMGDDSAQVIIDNGGNSGTSSSSDYVGVETSSPTGITDGTAQLRGIVTRGLGVDTWFVISDADRTPSCDGGSGVARVPGDTNRDSGSRSSFSSPVSGLSSGITYYYRACGTGQNGDEAEGRVVSFTSGGNDGNYNSTYTSNYTSTTNTNNSTKYTKPGKNTETQSNGDPLVETLAAQEKKKTSAKMRGSYNANGCPVVTWFEWSDDKSDLIERSKNVYQSNTYGMTSAYATGLKVNTTYYYRIVAQQTTSNCGDRQPVLGSIESFRTLSNSGTVASDTNTTNTVIRTVNTNNTARTTTVAAPQEISTSRVVDTSISGGGAGTSYLRLDISNGNDSPDVIEDKNIIIRGETIQYRLEWENLTDRDLNNGKIRVNLPTALKFIDSTRGLYDADSHSIYINIGNIVGRASDDVLITVEVLKSHAVGESVVVEAIAAFDDPYTLAQINAIDYDQDTIGQDRVNTLQASAFGTGFLGLGVAGWLILLFVIGLIFLLARYHALANAYRTTGTMPGYYGAGNPTGYVTPQSVQTTQYATQTYPAPTQYQPPQNIPTDIALPNPPSVATPDYSNQSIYRPYNPNE